MALFKGKNADVLEEDRPNMVTAPPEFGIEEDAPKTKKPKKAKGEPIAFEDFDWDKPVRPSAFLIADYLRRRRALKKARARTSSLVIWSILALAIISGLAFALHFMASMDRENAERDRDEAKNNFAKLAPVQQFFNGLDQRKAKVTETLNVDVDYSKVLGDIVDALPDGGELAEGTTSFGQKCPGPDPFTDLTSIGCVTFTVTVGSEAEASNFLSAMNDADNKFIVGTLVTSLTVAEADGNVTLAGTTNFTSNALSQRFAAAPPEGSGVTNPDGTPVTPAPTTPTDGSGQ